jgi:sensor histidine kinase YesM
MLLQRKLMMVFLLTILLPIIGLAFYFFSQTSQLIVRSVSETNQSILFQFNSGIAYNIRFYDSVLDSLTVSEAIQQALTQTDGYKDKGIFLMNKEIGQAVRFIEAYQAAEVESIQFYSLHEPAFSDGAYLFPVSRLYKELNRTMLPDGKFWSMEQKQGRHYYSLVRPIFSNDTFGLIGYIKLTVEIPAITHIREASVGMDTMEHIYLADSEGTVMYSADSTDYGQPLLPELAQLPHHTASKQEVLTLEIGGKPYYLWLRPIAELNWTSYLVIPRDSIEAEVREARQKVLAVSAGCAILFTLFTYFIVHQLTDNIRRLHKKVSRVGKGLLTAVRVKKPPVRSGDEITELERNFDTMLENLQSLIHQNYVEKLQKREMELNFLQSQINPHFLYNTLDAIKNEIDMDEKHSAIEMIVALADLFRISVSSSNLVSWEKEIYHTECYLRILAIRFGHHHRVIWDIDPQILPLYTLKVVLQPLVENAVRHGLKEKPAGGEVTITGELAAHAVSVTVQDNGCGMDAEQMERLLTQDPSHSGIGLRNVNSRIQMYFGPDYGLRIASVKGEGTAITLTLPVLEDDTHV